MEFCNGGFKPTKSIIAAWKVAKKPEKVDTTIWYKPIVKFQDTWEDYVKTSLNNKIGRDIKSKHSINIVLYGLSSKRFGMDKCTLPCTAATETSGPKPMWVPETKTLNIGISYDRRHMYGYTHWFESTLITAIKNKIIELEEA
jgi:hypothetical protein